MRCLQAPGGSLIDTSENAYRIGRIGWFRRPVHRTSFDGGVHHLDPTRSGRSGWRRQRDDELPGAAGGTRRTGGIELVREHGRACARVKANGGWTEKVIYSF